MTVNFDNAATTFPKPPSVAGAVFNAVKHYGGNAGRGGHKITMETSEKVYDTRQAAAEFFGAETENVIFTMNCTHALNLAIQGIMQSGGHIIISGIEHNSSARPVYALAKKGKCTFSIAEVSDSSEETVDNFRKLINSSTKAIVSVIAGNVTGQIMPYKELGKLCAENNLCFIADGAQACGILDIKMSDGINILCTSGHKGLYGPAGTGLLISDGKFHIEPIIQGGTGSSSLNLEQPDFLPDSLESGTVNTVGIIALKNGLDFVSFMGTDKIFRHESRLCRIFMDGLKDTGVIIYRRPGVSYVPIVSFNFPDVKPEDAAEMLNQRGFCLRAGLHCSPLAHHSLGTPEGTVRFAPSVFNNEHQVENLVKTIKKLQ
ncbi:aminotransferase class V-fold PLP-dependent enzyme [Porcipelethomonas sp.]|uniref:aminotransferase class V-fold PLP-dependent enzyme n=1 Tax=Porcipelethomonas sp. TaxID=2981675 RepID=UPI003EF0E923